MCYLGGFCDFPVGLLLCGGLVCFSGFCVKCSCFIILFIVCGLLYYYFAIYLGVCLIACVFGFLLVWGLLFICLFYCVRCFLGVLVPFWVVDSLWLSAWVWYWFNLGEMFMFTLVVGLVRCCLPFI